MPVMKDYIRDTAIELNFADLQVRLTELLSEFGDRVEARFIAELDNLVGSMGTRAVTSYWLSVRVLDQDGVAFESHLVTGLTLSEREVLSSQIEAHNVALEDEELESDYDTRIAQEYDYDLDNPDSFRKSWEDD